MISLIVARDKSGAIGKDGEIPWHAPEDLKAFKKATLGGALIMGRRTWESLPRRPLPGRLNIVISRRPDVAPNTCTSIEDAITLATSLGYREIFGIGGRRIYQDMLAIADRILLTEVGIEVDGADVFFPDIDSEIWVESARFERHDAGLDLTFRTLVRRSKRDKSPRG